MAASAAKFPGLRRNGFASRVALLLTIFAFAMQSFIAQTHIHVEAHGHRGTVHIAAAPVPASGKTLPGNSKENCPLCAAVAHAGAFLMPVAPFVFMSVWAQHMAPFIAASMIARTAGHNWRSRAPPLR